MIDCCFDMGGCEVTPGQVQLLQPTYKWTKSCLEEWLKYSLRSDIIYYSWYF